LRAPVLGDDGWARGLRRVASPNFGPRPTGTAIDLVVVHSISLPPGVYGGDAVERLFTNTLDCDADPYYDRLRGMQVSAHFVVARDGAATQYVSVHDRAWHAGASRWRGRADCNDYSVGIELEGLEGDAFEDAQYTTLALLRMLNTRHALAGVAGHEHVAPGRKQDPGPGFDWPRLRRRLRWPRALFA
jgi:N-acetyl-anhydromuramyl-L-alanine amidase AmpD